MAGFLVKHIRLVNLACGLFCFVAILVLHGFDLDFFRTEAMAAVVAEQTRDTTTASAFADDDDFDGTGELEQTEGPIVKKDWAPENRQQHSRRGKKPSSLGISLKMAALLIFFLMLFTPFIPGIIELYRPRDKDPLYIDMNYVKDPSYFGLSFRKKLDGAVLHEHGDQVQDNPGDTVRVESGDNGQVVGALNDIAKGGNNGRSSFNGKLSKAEDIEVSGSRRIESGERHEQVLYVNGDLVAGEDTEFHKELRVLGDAEIGGNSTLRAAAVDGRLNLGENVRVIRWFDAFGPMQVGAKSDLGVSTCCRQTLNMDFGVRFQRLCGAPISTYGADLSLPPMSFETGPQVPPDPEEEINNIEDLLTLKKHNVNLKKGEVIEGDIVIRGNLHTEEDVHFTGCIRAYGYIHLGPDCRVSGSVFAEGKIRVDSGGYVGGNIFSQDSVHLAKGVRVGTPNTIKSIIGKKTVVLEGDVAVYGYIETHGSGKVG